jgi:hypothetical protein
MRDSDLNKKSVHEAPDRDAVAAQSASPFINSAKLRATETAGAKGSNHIGQGSGGDSTHRAGVPTEPARKGNSAENNFDDDENQDVKKQIGAHKKTDQETDLAGGAERAAKGEPSKTSPEKAELPQP